MHKTSEKVAIVTGSSKGIGRSIAMQLASAGTKVVINYLTNRVVAERVVEEIEQTGGEAIAIRANVGKVAEVESLFKETIVHFGRVDVLVNNAGIMLTKPFLEITEDEYDRQMDVNVKGTFFAAQQAARHMREGGRIINFSTSVTRQMFPTYSAYAATKGAVEQITRQLAKELGPKGITINAIAPGPVNTDLFTEGKTQEQIAAVGKANAFGRIGEPKDIADVVLFLASEASQWVTGQTIFVNGGFI
ncbi:SDR family oxidoreductase [Alicyclobacillus tolerans]|uniref:SDR family oxidoreductase n=1 Tax=Alicyclobacillus tolerans TaxID=90970 RepID=UPI003B79176C